MKRRVGEQTSRRKWIILAKIIARGGVSPPSTGYFAMDCGGNDIK
jgi:hypothetical protein